MPRPRSRYPEYRLHRPSGQAVVTLAGQDHYLGAFDSDESRDAYDRAILEWVAAGRPRRPLVGDEMTIVELCLAFWNHAQEFYRRDGQPTGELFPQKSAIRLLRKAYGPTLARKFGTRQFKALRLKMIKLGWCRNTINRQAGRIRHIFRWAAAEELLRHSVYRRLQTVMAIEEGKTEARETLPVIAVEDAAVEAVLPLLPAVVADMVRLQRLTGARPGEICSIRPCDVNTSPEIWEYRPRTHKNKHRGKLRVICIGPAGQEILRPYLQRPADVYCFSPAESEQRRLEATRTSGGAPGTNATGCNGSESGPPGTRRRKPGQRYSTDSYRRAVQRAVETTKQNQWSPNQLRHAAADQTRDELGIEAAQAVLGHANVKTAEIYAKGQLKRAQEVARRLG